MHNYFLGDIFDAMSFLTFVNFFSIFSVCPFSKVTSISLLRSQIRVVGAVAAEVCGVCGAVEEGVGGGAEDGVRREARIAKTQAREGGLVADGDEVFVGAEDEGAVDDGGGGVSRFAEGVLREFFVFLGVRAEDDRGAGLVGRVSPAFGEHD